MSIAIGTWTLLAKIADGGRTELWRADCSEHPGTIFAVKRVRKPYMDDPAALKRLRHGAEIAATLKHPHIVESLLPVEAEGELLLPMALLSGADLANRMKATPAPWPVEVAVSIAAQAAMGLGAVHKAGIVHRNVKPDNLFVGDDGGVRLLDFRLALRRSGAAVPQTDVGAQASPNSASPPESSSQSAPVSGEKESRTVGTPAYMAPETIRAGETGPAVDVYAVGLLLYRMLMGCHPFDVPTDASALVVMAHVDRAHREGPLPVLARPDLPQGLADIVAACLSADPAHRPADGDALALALRPFWSGTPSPLEFKTVDIPATNRPPETGSPVTSAAAGAPASGGASRPLPARSIDMPPVGTVSDEGRVPVAVATPKGGTLIPLPPRPPGDPSRRRLVGAIWALATLSAFLVPPLAWLSWTMPQLAAERDAAQRIVAAAAADAQTTRAELAAAKAERDQKLEALGAAEAEAERLRAELQVAKAGLLTLRDARDRAVDEESGRVLRTRCDGGDATACRDLARAYAEAAGVGDRIEALALLLRACEALKEASACGEAGRMAREVPFGRNPTELFAQGCRHGDLEACADLGDTDHPDALRETHRACDLGVARACAVWGRRSGNLFGLERGCDGGDPGACLAVGAEMSRRMYTAHAATAWSKGCKLDRAGDPRVGEACRRWAEYRAASGDSPENPQADAEREAEVDAALRRGCDFCDAVACERLSQRMAGQMPGETANHPGFGAIRPPVGCPASSTP